MYVYTWVYASVCIYVHVYVYVVCHMCVCVFWKVYCYITNVYEIEPEILILNGHEWQRAVIPWETIWFKRTDNQLFKKVDLLPALKLVHHYHLDIWFKKPIFYSSLWFSQHYLKVLKHYFKAMWQPTSTITNHLSTECFLFPVSIVIVILNISCSWQRTLLKFLMCFCLNFSLQC